MSIRTFRSRRGFTLVETIIALTVAVVLVGLTATAVYLASRNKRDIVAAGKMQGVAGDADEVIRRSVEQAGQRLFSSYNLSGVNAVTVGPDGAARDTLITLSARGRAILNSTQECTALGAAGCLRLIGDVREEINVGDLVVTGSPQSGGRILQVMAVQGPVSAPCGADCQNEALQLTRNTTGTVQELVVVSHTINWKNGTQTTEAGGCPPLAQNPLWSSCTENTELRDLGEQATVTAAAGAGQAWMYTEIRYADRTGIFAYPDAPTWTPRSGAGGTPSVYTQQIRFSRMFVDERDPETPTLVRQSTISPSGKLGAPEPVAHGVTNFRVRTQHRGQTTLERGVGLTAGQLALESSNPNYRSGGTGEQSYSFDKSYSTIASVRVDYEVLDRRVEGGDVGARERASRPLAVAVATPHLLEGGVIDTRASESGYHDGRIDESDIKNAPPVARMRVNPNPAVLGQSVSFQDDGSRDPDGTIALYTWNAGDGSAPQSGPSLTSASHVYTVVGSYDATLTVTDNLGLSGTHIVTVRVLDTNLAPVADFIVPSPALAGSVLAFRDASTDADGTIRSRVWTTSDGQSASGEIASFRFAAAGTPSVTLKVTDDRGATATVTKTITVTSDNQLPIARITPPGCAASYCQAGQSYIFSGATSSDADGTIVRYSWGWGDGTAPGSGVSVSHTFQTGGTRVVSLTVTDNAGGTGSSSVPVTVNAAPLVKLVMPPCALTQAGCFMGQSYTFDGSGSSDPDGSITAWSLDLGDGTVVPASSATHTFTSPGSFTVTLRATDDRGNIGIGTGSIRIGADVRPVVTCPATVTLAQGESRSVTCSVRNPSATDRTYSLRATSSDVGILTVAKASDLVVGGGKTVSAGLTLTAGTSRAGSAVVALSVADREGAAGQAQIAATVNASYGVSITEVSSIAAATNWDAAGAPPAGGPASIRMGESAYGPLGSNGLTVLVFDKNNLNAPESSAFFATGSLTSESNALASLLSGLPKGKITVVISSGSWNGALTDNLRSAMGRLGLGGMQTPPPGIKYYNAIVDSDDPARNLEGFGISLRGSVALGKVMGADRVVPNGRFRRGFRVTNLSSQTSPVEVTATCGAPISSCGLYAASGISMSRTRPLAPDSSQDIYLEGVAGSTNGTGAVRIIATLGSTADTAAFSVRVGDPATRSAPALSGPGDFVDAPGASGSRHVIVGNPWFEGRRFTLAPSPTSGVIRMSADASVWVESGGSQSVPLRYAVSASAVAGQSAAYGVTVSDGLVSASATGQFTVADVVENPRVIAPPEFSVSPGENNTVNFRLVSNSSAFRTYTLTLSSGGIVQSVTAAPSIGVAAHDTVNIAVGYRIDANAQSGRSGSIILTASSGGFSGSDAATMTVGLVLQNPIVTAPLDRPVTAGSTGQSFFRVRNASNSHRTLAIKAERTGVVAQATTPGTLSLDGQKESSVAVDWTISKSAVAGTTGTVRVTASDGAFSGSGTQTLTAQPTFIAPTVVGTGDMVVQAGTVGTKNFNVQHNGNEQRGLTLIAGRSGVVTNASVASPQTFQALESRPIGVLFSISPTAIEGDVGSISLTASDGALTSGATSVGVTVSATRGISIKSVSGVTFDPLNTITFRTMVANVGNADAKVVFSDIGPAGTGNGSGTWHARITGPGVLTLPANTSTSVTFSGAVASTAVGGENVVGRIRVALQSDPTVRDSADVNGTVGSLLAAPVVVLPANFNADPSATGTFNAQVTNKSNSRRTFNLGISSSDPGVVTATAAATVTLNPGQTLAVPVTWTMGSTALAGSVGTITVTATDGSYSGNANLKVTTNPVDRAPITEANGDLNGKNGAPLSQLLWVTNQSNTTRTICTEHSYVDGNVPASSVLTGSPDNKCIALAAYSATMYSARNFSVAPSAQAGWYASVRVRTYISGVAGYESFTTFRVTVDQNFGNPTVACTPTSKTTIATQSDSGSCTVSHNSNGVINYSISTSRDGTYAVSSSAAGSLSVPAFGSASTGLSWTAGSTPGTGWARLTASANGYSGSHQIAVTAADYVTNTYNEDRDVFLSRRTDSSCKMYDKYDQQRRSVTVWASGKTDYGAWTSRGTREDSMGGDPSCVKRTYGESRAVPGTQYKTGSPSCRLITPIDNQSRSCTEYGDGNISCTAWTSTGTTNRDDGGDGSCVVSVYDDYRDVGGYYYGTGAPWCELYYIYSVQTRSCTRYGDGKTSCGSWVDGGNYEDYAGVDSWCVVDDWWESRTITGSQYATGSPTCELYTPVTEQSRYCESYAGGGTSCGGWSNDGSYDRYDGVDGYCIVDYFTDVVDGPGSYYTENCITIWTYTTTTYDCARYANGGYTCTAVGWYTHNEFVGMETGGSCRQQTGSWYEENTEATWSDCVGPSTRTTDYRTWGRTCYSYSDGSSDCDAWSTVASWSETGFDRSCAVTCDPFNDSDCDVIW